ncbi:hypothetical protein KY285_016045 [Solanum tuberosum]|nr:hypothetical protein KY285_016045 [Solanum tuberosum]
MDARDRFIRPWARRGVILWLQGLRRGLVLCCRYKLERDIEEEDKKNAEYCLLATAFPSASACFRELNRWNLTRIVVDMNVGAGYVNMKLGFFSAAGMGRVMSERVG